MVIKGNNGNVIGNVKQELGILTNTKWLMVGRPPEKNSYSDQWGHHSKQNGNKQLNPQTKQTNKQTNKQSSQIYFGCNYESKHV